jgi:peptidoglycan/LPS O-acetylase OafA/YrhL
MIAHANRVESVTLAVILAVVAVAAGWASFTHVHDWTMRHAPAGTPDAFGWVNAVISELIPVAAFLTIRQRRRAGAPIGYPLALLIASAALSLSAQLAVAQPSPSGWLLSAVPALAFMALVKLVFATPAGPAPVTPVTPPTSAAPVEHDEATDPAPADVRAAVARPAAVVPVPANAFARVNGTPVIGQVTR